MTPAAPYADIHVTAIPAGDSARPAIARGVLASIAVGALFVAVTWTAKEFPALYVHEPWQDDPYDAIVSFAIIAVTMLTAIIAARAVLCLPSEPLPTRRAVDLLRAGRTNLVLVTATLASDWVSVALQTHRSSWTHATALMIGGLAVVTLLTGAAAVLLRRGGRVAPAYTEAPDQPDWAADALELSERAATWLGTLQAGVQAALRRVDIMVVARVRRHPLLAAGGFAAVFGTVFDAPQILIEGYSPPLAALFITISACSLFAFLVIVGAHLRLIGRSADQPTPATRVVVLVSLSVPLAASFRGSLWWLIGTNDRAAGLAQFAELLAVCAAAAGVLAVTGELVVRAARQRSEALR